MGRFDVFEDDPLSGALVFGAGHDPSDAEIERAQRRREPATEDAWYRRQERPAGGYSPLTVEEVEE